MHPGVDVVVEMHGLAFEILVGQCIDVYIYIYLSFNNEPLFAKTIWLWKVSHEPFVHKKTHPILEKNSP